MLRIAVPSPRRRAFDYWMPEGSDAGEFRPGTRVRVPFGRGTRLGVVLEAPAISDVAPERLKCVIEPLDREPIVPPATLALLAWASRYYHHPIGEVVLGALPALLRRGRTARTRRPTRWRVTPEGARAPTAALSRAPRQTRLLQRLRSAPHGIAPTDLEVATPRWRPAMAALRKRGWVEEVPAPEEDPPPPATSDRVEPNASQTAAIDAIYERAGRFHPFLLDGVTGSGKTEIYLTLIERFLAGGRQALVLIPEIGLTPQMVERFRARLAGRVAVLHSGRPEQARLKAWTDARDGTVSVVIGTRSAVFVPLARPGIIIVDEEHDLSYKQQEGFRYSARDIALVRGRLAEVPVVLGSATPSLESLRNADTGRYRHLLLGERPGGAAAPRIDVVDIRGRRLDSNLSPPLLRAVEDRLARREQILLFVNRRGYAPVVLCHACGWVADCPRCDAHLVYHHTVDRLRCHHCGRERPALLRCPGCGASDLIAIGSGTQRVAQALARRFPAARVARLDRDATRGRDALETVLGDIRSGATDILVGTQMLAKGHHFPNVTLVGILDADGGLFGADFRAGERMAQLVVQVAGRAGRGDRPGRVLIQTHHPDHPLLRALISVGYREFARAALAERAEAGLPPMSRLALLRAEAARREANFAFLDQAAALAREMGRGEVEVLGPIAAPMERRGGRFRAQLLLQSADRARLHRLLEPWLPLLETLKSARRVRWSLDVDPQELV